MIMVKVTRPLWYWQEESVPFHKETKNNHMFFEYILNLSIKNKMEAADDCLVLSKRSLHHKNEICKYFEVWSRYINTFDPEFV